jgi:hypothetical protein
MVTQFGAPEQPEADRNGRDALGARDETAYHAALGAEPEQNKSGGNE